MSDANKDVVRRVFEEAVNTGKLELLNGLIAEDYTSPSGASATGPEAFVKPIRALSEAFPDIRYQLKDLIAEGDQVAVRWTWSGTHRNVYRGPTGYIRRRASSSRTTEGGLSGERGQGPARVAAHRSPGIPARGRGGAQTLMPPGRQRASKTSKSGRGDVTLAGVGEHDHDELALALGRGRDLQRGRPAPRPRRCRRGAPPRARAGGASKASSSLTASTSSMIARFSTSGMKPAPMPWMRWLPGLPPESTAALAGSTATMRTPASSLEHLADAGDGAAGAHAGDEDVDRAAGVVPDLGAVVRRCASGFAGLLELLQHHRAGLLAQISPARSTASRISVPGVSTTSAPR
jgi:hypothetical protein